MKKFVTAFGEVIIERDKLFIRSFYLPFTKTGFVKIMKELFWLAGFVLQFYRDEPRKYFGVAIWGLVIISRVSKMYDVLFRRSYTRFIPLNRIASFAVADDQYGYHTIINLQLKNGRYRKLVFRKLEHQTEPFADFLSTYLSVPKPA